LLFLTIPSDRTRAKTENITYAVDFQPSGLSAQSESVKPTNKGVPLNYNVSQTELYHKHTKASFLFLLNGFHGVIAYIVKQDQQQRKYQDQNDSTIRGYQLIDSTKWHQIWE
jgi:hypothetical protein